MHKSGCRGIAKKVRAVFRSRAAHSDRTSGGTSHRGMARGGSTRRWSTALVTVIVAAVGSVSLLAMGGLTAMPAFAASGAPAVTQCNPPDFPTGAGYQVTCNVSVDNYTSPSGGTLSTVTTSACLAAAGVVYPSCPLNLGPVVTTTNSFQLVTSVNQCNGITNGAGSNVYCNVTVTNHIPAGTPESGVTVDQCVGSAAGSTQACAPLGSTTNATVTQCNGSANGGGTYAGEPAAGCTVTGADSALPVTINQCNGTSNGGGSAVTCTATVADVFAPASTTPTPPAERHRWDHRVRWDHRGGWNRWRERGRRRSRRFDRYREWRRRCDRHRERRRGYDRHRCGSHSHRRPADWVRGASLSTNPALVYAGGVALTAAGVTMVLAIRRRRASKVPSRQNQLS